MTRELKRLEKGPKSGNTHQFTQNDTKKYHSGKHKAMMEYIGFVSRNFPPFMTD